MNRLAQLNSLIRRAEYRASGFNRFSRRIAARAYFRAHNVNFYEVGRALDATYHAWLIAWHPNDWHLPTVDRTFRGIASVPSIPSIAPPRRRLGLWD